MIKQGIVEAVSYKTRKAKIAGQWLPVSRDVDLRTLKWGRKHTFDAEKNFDDEWFIKEVKDPVPYEETK
jgi:hypothetical protein